MQAPLPPPETRYAGPPLADDGIRLDIRIGAGRPLAYSILGEEFLIGGAAGCDLQLAGSGVPPVILQFHRAADGLSLRRLAPHLPSTLNGKTILGAEPISVRHGDQVGTGPIEITVQIPLGSYLSPKLIPIADARAESQLEERERTLSLREKAFEEQYQAWELAKRTAVPARADISADTHLQARRQELEAEWMARHQAHERLYQERLHELETRIATQRLQFEQESYQTEPRLVQVRMEQDQLAAARATLAAEQSRLNELRTQFERERGSVSSSESWQSERLGERERILNDREAELSRREDRATGERAAIDSDRAKLKDDQAKLDDWRGELETRQTDLDARAAEVEHRFGLLSRHADEWEETVRLASAEQSALNMDREQLQLLRQTLDQRDATLTERAAQLEALQATLQQMQQNIERQFDDLRRESAELATEKVRHQQAEDDLREQLREAVELREQLSLVPATAAQAVEVRDERGNLLSVTLEEIARQKDELAAAEERLRIREAELDAGAAEFAERASLLRSRAQQIFELQERLEADRRAWHTAQETRTDTDAGRMAFQEQLRKRAADLAHRAKEVDEQTRQLAEERARLESQLAAHAEDKTRHAERTTQDAEELSNRATELREQAEILAEREATLTRQVGRLKEVGEAVSAERKALFDARAAWDAERAEAEKLSIVSQEHASTIQTQVAAHFAELKREAPELEQQASTALAKLGSARDILRGHLTELHEYAKQTREELDTARAALRADSVELERRDEELDRHRADHRRAVTEFRQQLLDWQGKIAEWKQTLATAENRLSAREAELAEATATATATAAELSERTAAIEQERSLVSEKRTEMERHLGEMRDWYRRKLRELAAGRAVDESDMPTVPWRNVAATAPTLLAMTPPPSDDAEPGDDALGELLRSRGFLDEITLDALKSEARRQRRSLRQVLLSSGAVTLYQLALIEAGNLDGLSLGRLRVVDRVRASAKETIYRVFDPARPTGPTRGIYLLRHLNESELADAIRPDEFRERYRAAAQAAHPNLGNTIEVLDVQRRPAALQEWVPGLLSTDWPLAVSTPGVWLKLLSSAARAVGHLHRSGLVHGRIAPDNFILMPDGTLKLLGTGDPAWLTPGAGEGTPSTDLRLLGQTAFTWSQIAARRKGARPKPFPAELTTVVRRLELGTEPPMADVVAIDRPYLDAAELSRDLTRLAELHPCPSEIWDKLLRYTTETTPEQLKLLSQAG